MAFYLVAAGTSLQVVTPAGGISTITLPSPTTVHAGRPARFAVLGRTPVGVNAFSRPVFLDPDGICYPLSVSKPSRAPTVAAGAAGGLTGTFASAVAFGIKDELGRVLLLTDMGPISDNVTVAAQVIAYSNIPVSVEPKVNFRRLYRTTAGPGASYFEVLDIDDNITTSLSNGTSDEALAVLPAPEDMGSAPARLELITEWKGFLWGKTSGAIDSLFFTDGENYYAWPPAHEIKIPPLGNDTVGINGLIRRRDELGVGRLDRWWKIVGDDPDNFARLVLIEGTGIRAPDSVVVIRDVGYWLWDDGVYRWGPDGVASVSKQKAHAWFATDDYFNRAEYSRAIGWHDQTFDTYNLLLCAAGSTTLDRWVSYEVKKDRWFGPHRTSVGTPTFAALLLDASERAMPSMCFSDGYIRKMNQATFSDDGTAISFDVRLRHNCKTPDIEKVFKHLSMLTRVEAGGTLTITPALGGVSASDQATISHNLTLGRQLLRRLSTIAQPIGRILTLKFTNAENNQGVHIYGYELPYHEVGRR